ncbi:unnamed protein product [Coffea canephora]|uniref:Leucine-rich repeat-containing N-terminal plant-type domain-containing protein n=1 Tax=Coffea canephora TaxID=49390 RepID=A0A068V7U2_COFCA|nr:unnamed protein product [Coffea canephora]
MGFADTIPARLGNLSFRISLDMSNNSFHGYLPKEMSHLRQLKLDLSRNLLIGQILSALSNCSRLESLDLSYNQFSGYIPKQGIGNLTMLKKLYHIYLTWNNFSGAILASISNCSKLAAISLGHNKFSGQIPNSIISLCHNKFSGQISNSIGNLRCLAVIDLSANNLTSEFSSSELGLFTSPNRLHIFKNCGLKGNIPDSIGNLSNLVILGLGDNSWTGSIPTTIAEINLSSSFLRGPLAPEMGELKDLESLDLSNNQFSGKILSSIWRLESLDHLSLANNSLQESISDNL